MVKIISSGKNDLKGMICCRKRIQRKNCEICQMKTGLAGLVKICKRKRDVIYSQIVVEVAVDILRNIKSCTTVQGFSSVTSVATVFVVFLLKNTNSFTTAQVVPSSVTSVGTCFNVVFPFLAATVANPYLNSQSNKNMILSSCSSKIIFLSTKVAKLASQLLQQQQNISSYSVEGMSCRREML